jgi:hypothetical protein
MHEIDRRHIAALLTGHVSLIETPEGVQSLRMPAGDACRWRIAGRTAKTPERTRDCGRHPGPNPYSRRASVGDKDTLGVQSVVIS